jgi:hypothetical protein
MSRSQYGMLAGMAGMAGATAIATWWFTHRMDYVARKMSEAGRDHMAEESMQ